MHSALKSPLLMFYFIFMNMCASKYKNKCFLIF